MWVGRDPSHRIDAYILDTSFDRPVIAYDYGPHMDDVGLHIAYEQVLFDGNLDGKMCLRQNDPVGLTVCKHWGRETKPFTLILLQIFANLPVFTATPERTFSAMKILKTYLRSRLT